MTLLFLQSLWSKVRTSVSIRSKFAVKSKLSGFHLKGLSPTCVKAELDSWEVHCFVYSNKILRSRKVPTFGGEKILFYHVPVHTSLIAMIKILE